jgi:hypothetical protein
MQSISNPKLTERVAVALQNSHYPRPNDASPSSLSNAHASNVSSHSNGIAQCFNLELESTYNSGGSRRRRGRDAEFWELRAERNQIDELSTYRPCNGTKGIPRLDLYTLMAFVMNQWLINGTLNKQCCVPD